MSKQDYLDLVAKKAAERKPVELEMPSGATWILSPVNLQQFAVAGRLPLHLVGELDSVKELLNSDAQILERERQEKELTKIGVQNLLIVRDVMLNNLIYPKITLTETDDSITPEQIDPEDFEFFSRFIISGGQSTEKKSSPGSSKKKKNS